MSLRPSAIVADIRHLCETIRVTNNRATVIVSEILPRAANMFPGCDRGVSFLDKWNREAATTNRLLREMAERCDWIQILQHPQFHTMFGMHIFPSNLNLLRCQQKAKDKRFLLNYEKCIITISLSNAILA